MRHNPGGAKGIEFEQVAIATDEMTGIASRREFQKPVVLWIPAHREALRHLDNRTNAGEQCLLLEPREVRGR